MSSESLNVIGLISGGKDSFFSLLHCISHGHRVVALANLYPDDVDTSGHTPNSTAVQVIEPGDEPSGQTPGPREPVSTDAPQDLNSFMYQTVGHEVVPLYAAATGLPLYRQPILGGAVRHERDYHYDADGTSREVDETESMVPLLRSVMARHPEANALCAGAILSTYQRTRVESVALRLGLVPLAYLWQYPSLPAPTSPVDDAQLLSDMCEAGVDARIIKVASAGLDERYLWQRVTEPGAGDRIKAALRRFGAARGAALGEGGEFETLVLDGPPSLFRKSIIVPDEGRLVIGEEGGTSWLMLRGARLEEKGFIETRESPIVRRPAYFDENFQQISERLRASEIVQRFRRMEVASPSKLLAAAMNSPSAEHVAQLFQWRFFARAASATEADPLGMLKMIDEVRETLTTQGVDASLILNTIVVLRDISDFPQINASYGQLFTRPSPPARVTISCGDLLPDGVKVALYIVAPMPGSKIDRDGLHVQSRSYWAPANIGPYSQAIGSSITPRDGTVGLKVVSVAGQIPLIPASMELPSGGEAVIEKQMLLALQHLWRIGQERQVQYWTSAVVYFSRTDADAQMKRNAEVAGRAWSRLHELRDDDDDDDADGGLDPWDLKYNPQYMSLGPSAGEASAAPLPDFSVLPLQQQNEPDCCVPPFFAAEIESLPRGALVEWHAHLGIGGAQENSTEHLFTTTAGSGGWSAWHTIVRGSGCIFHHSVAYSGVKEAAALSSHAAMVAAASTARMESLQKLGLNQTASDEPYLVYIDTTAAGRIDDGSQISSALVPCRSLWSSQGQRVGAIALYRTVLAADRP